MADGLARYLYNLSSLVGLQGEGERERLMAFSPASSTFLSAWLDFLSGHARSPQLLTEDHPLVTGLLQASLLRENITHVTMCEYLIISSSTI